jgi:DME family drug/metabolite transporter
VAGNAFAFAACLPMALPVQNAGVKDLAVIGYLGVIQIGLAYVCVAKGIRHVPALEASSLLLVEPALNPVWAWMIHGEQPSAWALSGGALILAATLVKSRRG